MTHTQGKKVALITAQTVAWRVAVTQAFLPLLKEAPSAGIVNVSSALGSLTLNSDPSFSVPWWF